MTVKCNCVGAHDVSTINTFRFYQLFITDIIQGHMSISIGDILLLKHAHKGCRLIYIHVCMFVCVYYEYKSFLYDRFWPIIEAFLAFS